jgi:anaerobic selenocysteine-containing dehydrogenase
MHPEDIVSCGLKDGDAITLSLDDGTVSVSGPARSNGDCPKGVIYYTRPVVFGGLRHRRGLWPLYRLEENPVWVSLSGTTAGKT